MSQAYKYFIIVIIIKKNVQFLRKIPANAESANIMVGQIAELKRPVGAFLRFEDSRVLGNLTEVPV